MEDSKKAQDEMERALKKAQEHDGVENTIWNKLSALDLVEQVIGGEEGPEQQAGMMQEISTTNVAAVTTTIDVAVVDIVDDIIELIISKFPPIPLFRNQCVSKGWKQMIKAVLASRIEDTRFLIPASVLHSIEVNQVPPHTMAFVGPTIQGYMETMIIGSLKGSMFIVSQGFVYERRYYLLNLSLGEAIQVPENPVIPSLSILDRRMCCFSFGLGYGNADKDLKLVCVFKSNRENSLICDIYDVSGSTWLWLNPPRMKKVVDIESDVGAFLENYRSIYWLGIERERSELVNTIVRLDLVKMDFYEIPVDLGEALPVSYSFGNFYDNLAFLVQLPDGSHSFRIMHGDDQWAEVQKRQSLHLRFPEGFHLMACSNEKLLLYTENKQYRPFQHQRHAFTRYNIFRIK